MRYYELDKEEREILDALEKGKLKRVKNFTEEKRGLERVARLTFLIK